MRVMVKGRAEGKTTALIDWLLQGEQIKEYPGWSRVIVCVTREMVVYTDRKLKQEIEKLQWDVQCTKCLPHTIDECETVHTRAFFDARKCIWGMRDFDGMRGRRNTFDYAVDDAESLIRAALGYPYKGPAAITITGEAWV